MEIDEKLYWFGFSLFNGIGPKRFALLKNYFGSAQKAWQASLPELLKVGLNPQLAQSFVEFRQKTNLDSSFLRLREKKIECQTIDDKNYPENLKKIDNPPFILYKKGEIKTQDSLAIAVVGTRKMSSYGKQVTEKLVSELVGYGLTIVSGLARGVDTIAHQTAVNCKGRTIGVLACGLDLIYPPENKILAEKIINGYGSVISEFPPGCQAVPGNFPARNRIIAGLSLGTLVIEGEVGSGSLITARHAVEQGREVFAVPGPITSSNSAGPALLIKQGAKLVENVQDILEELNIDNRTKNIVHSAKEIRAENPEEEIIFNILINEEKHIDQIIRESKMDIGKVTSLLTMMEIKGMIKNLGNMIYVINNR
ncbi:MAG: DNA-processing protein DprA [Candidatus Shapirobacteria bacterium]|nr:DNA-processing protein DprA [Candidatus Shapirobacteria bacterium]